MNLPLEETVKQQKIHIHQLQKELEDLKENTRKEREYSINLHLQLLKVLKVYDEHTYQELTNQLTRLDYKTSIFQQPDIILKTQVILQNQTEQILNFHNKIKRFITEIPTAALDSPTLSNDLKGKAEELRSRNKSNKNLSENIIDLLEYIAQGIKRFNRSSIITNNFSLPEDIKKDFYRIFSTLQVNEEQNETIKSCMDKLLTDVSYIEFPNIVKIAINALIKSTYQEREDSSHNISNIYNHICSIHDELENSVNTNTSINNSSKENNDLFNLELTNMNINLSTADTDSLTELLNDNINKLRHLSDERINITDMHEQMLSNLTVIEHKVSEVKKEANTLKNTIHEIANKSKCDPLTRLLNINSFNQHIEDCMKMLNEQQLHVFIADIDNFGDINKEYNTAVGDKILKVLAITMRKVLPPEIIIARLAGAHFGIIIQNADQKKTSAILEKLIACVKAIPFHYRNTKVDVSISVTGFQVTTPMQPTQVISKLENYVTQTKDHEGKVITRSHLHIIPQ